MEATENVEAQNGPAVTRSGLLCLFVGGPHDGRRIRVRTEAVIKLPDPEHYPANDHEYYRETFASEDKRWTVYRHSSISAPDALQMLLDGYRHNLLLSPKSPKPQESRS